MEENKLNVIITKLLVERLEVYKGRSLDKQICTEIYQTLFNSLADIFSKSKAPLSNESVNFIAQCYYNAVEINNRQILDPNIFSQKASLSNVPTKELALLALMLKFTDFAPVVFTELKKR